MSAMTTSSGLFYRIRHTPMRDVLRGQLTGRLDIKQHIAQSGLPQPASELIQRVIRRTHLRPLEKVDVANELIAHFSDGLDAGKTIDELLRSFGDERQAARLIRRAKLRNRSFIGRAQTIVVRGAVTSIVIYILIGIYFFSGEATRDSPIELKNYISQLPPEDAAWPIYQKAADAQMAGDHRKAAELVRQAASRPAIGYIEPPLDPKSYYPSSLGGDSFDAGRELWPTADFNAVVIRPSYELEYEASRAWRHGDHDIPLRGDIDAMDQLCRQWHPDPSISSFEAIWMFRQEICQIDRTLDVAPTLFTGEDLRHFANQIAR